jgi:hypothetical protein
VTFFGVLPHSTPLRVRMTARTYDSNSKGDCGCNCN